MGDDKKNKYKKPLYDVHTDNDPGHMKRDSLGKADEDKIKAFEQSVNNPLEQFLKKFTK